MIFCCCSKLYDFSISYARSSKIKIVSDIAQVSYEYGFFDNWGRFVRQGVSVGMVDMLIIGDDSSPFFEDFASWFGVNAVGNVTILSRDIVRDYSEPLISISHFTAVPYSVYKGIAFGTVYTSRFGIPDYDRLTISLVSPPVLSKD